MGRHLRGATTELISPSKRGYDVRTLSAKHHSMLRMMLLGSSNNDIAEAVGMTPPQVAIVRNSPIAMQHMNTLIAARDSQVINVAKGLRDDAPKSLKLLQEVRDGGHQADIGLRASVAKDLLDRAGHGKVSRVEGTIEHNHGVFVESMLDRVKARRAVPEAPADMDYEEAELVELEEILTVGDD